MYISYIEVSHVSHMKQSLTYVICLMITRVIHVSHMNQSLMYVDMSHDKQIRKSADACIYIHRT